MTVGFTAATFVAAAGTLVLAGPAYAQTKSFGGPTAVGETVTFDPILDSRLRHEHVETPNQPATEHADAVTLRLRAGFELKHIPSSLSLLAEAEGTVGLANHYNALPFPIADSQRRPGFDVVADPRNVELNRLQLQYRTKSIAVTIGRQRINLDDQRWVGAVGWRQNEQTFDALRAEASLGPISVDATYSTSQRTIFGTEAGPRLAFDGEFAFAGLGVKAGPIQLKGFAYLNDYDAKEQSGSLIATMPDSQTWGIRATAAFPLGRGVKLNLAASYARQMDWRDNPADYQADYIAAEASFAWKGLSLTGGYELLGSDRGRAVQTPMATLHKFNGWADTFLTTPSAGLEDIYAGLGKNWPRFHGLSVQVTYHEFHSDAGRIRYGTEWDASLGAKAGPVGLLVKYADYDADALGTDKRIIWFQAEYGF